MKLNILKSWSLLFAMATALVACSDPEGVIYKGDGAPEYAFAGANQKVEMLATDGNKITVPVYRGNTNGASSIDLSLKIAEGIEEGLFTLSTPTVNFVDGQSVGEAIITYSDINDLSAAAIYKMSLSFEEEKASPSKVNTISISAQRKLTFKSIGTGFFTTQFFGGGWDQPVEKAEEANVYRLPDCYIAGYPIMFSLDEEGNVSGFVDQETGYVHSEYGMVSVNYQGSMRQGKTITFALLFYVDAGDFGVSEETIELP